MTRALTVVLTSAVLAALSAGCGSSGTTTTSTTSGQPAPSATSATTPSSGSSGTTGAGALSADATSAATGDIPDNQVFLTYHDAAAGYSIVYPEGWARRGNGSTVTFSDKNNQIRIVVGPGAAPTAAGLAAELTQLKQSNPTLTAASPTAIQVKSGPAVKAVYTTKSAPNPVTGKTVLLIVDRYELAHAGKRVTVDLGTPRGVDNIDAYKRIINSLAWQ